MTDIHHAAHPARRVLLDWKIVQPFLNSPVATGVVLAVAALIRCWRLGYHSVWFDEAVSLQWAASDAAFIWQKSFPLVEDKHPPVYYLLLHFWRQVMGLLGLANSDVALRLLGGILGVLTVLGILLLAQRLSGRLTALLTGLLVALAPVLVWYSQELRMFQPATTGLVWGAYCLLRAWDAPTVWRRATWWGGFVLVMEAALYSYLFSAFLLPAAGFSLLALVLFCHRGKAAADLGGADLLSVNKKSAPPRSAALSSPSLCLRRFAGGVSALTLTGLLFLPLAYNAWIVNNSEGEPGQAFAGLGETLWRLLRIFTLWRVDWPATAVTVALCCLAAFILLGLLLPRMVVTKPALISDRLYLVLWIGIPLLIGNLLLSRSASVFQEDRYFIFIAPFVLWAMARGIVVVGERLPWLGMGSALAVVVLLGVALPRLWTPALYRENWRAASDYITTYHAVSPGLSDMVVAHVDYTRLPLEWYLRQHFTFDQLPLYFPYGGALTPEQMDAVIAPPLEGIVATGAATLWLTQSHLEGVDDQHLVEGWLNARFPLVTELYPSGIKLSGYALQSQFSQLPPLAAAARYPATELAPSLELAACEVLTPQVTAQDSQIHPPSGWVHVRLWWRAVGPIRDDYIATAEVVGPEGAWGVRLYRANEALRRWPTSTWQVGVIVRDEIDINLNPVTPPRLYPVVIGAMDSAGQWVGQNAQCGEVTVR
ncbi:MAG: glycosyltransferase family 39 protein [Caldilineaceae bacterium]